MLQEGGVNTAAQAMCLSCIRRAWAREPRPMCPAGSQVLALPMTLAVALAVAIWKVEKSEKKTRNFNSSQNGLACSGKS